MYVAYHTLTLDHDVPQLPPITPSDGRIMNGTYICQCMSLIYSQSYQTNTLCNICTYIHTAHHFNGTGAKQIDHEPQNNALIKDDLEAAPLKKEINTDNVAEDKGIILYTYVCTYILEAISITKKETLPYSTYIHIRSSQTKLAG